MSRSRHLPYSDPVGVALPLIKMEEAPGLLGAEPEKFMEISGILSEDAVDLTKVAGFITDIAWDMPNGKNTQAIVLYALSEITRIAQLSAAPPMMVAEISLDDIGGILPPEILARMRAGAAGSPPPDKPKS